MPSNASLPISLLANVTASLQAVAAQAQSTQTMLILVDDPTIDVVTRIENFTSGADIASQTGSDSPATAASVVWFDQVPQPPSLLLGRWAQSNSAGQLLGGPLSATQQAIATWNAVTNGGFTITVDGGSAQPITGLNFSTAANLNAVASAIQADLTGAIIVWDALHSRFTVTSATSGASSQISFATAPGSGTDISIMLGLRSTSSGAYTAHGMLAETALAAVTYFDQQFGNQFYGLAIVGASDSDYSAVANLLAASSNKHFLFVSTQEAGVLVPATTTDIAYVLKAANSSKVAVQYNGASPYSGISLAGRILPVDYTGQNTDINLMYKTEPGITPDNLNVGQLNSALGKNCNVFVNYNNGAAIIQPGVCSNGAWIDTVIGTDALVLAIQTAVFNLLYTSTTKIPQSDAGMHQVKVTIESVCEQFRQNGFLAPGVWEGQLFGGLKNNNDGTPPTLAKGYYVYAPPIALQSLADRQKRLSVPFQVAARLAGAVQTVNVSITLLD